MTFTSEPRRILRQLAIANQIATSVLSHGIVDLFRDPRAAADYWRGIAAATVYPRGGDSRKLLDLPRCHLEKIVPSAESIPVTLIDYQYTYGGVSVDDLITLCRIVRSRRPSIIFEIGTYLGGTTLQLAANSDAKVYTLDLPPSGHRDFVQPQIWDPELDVYPDRPGLRYQETIYMQRI